MLALFGVLHIYKVPVVEEKSKEKLERIECSGWRGERERERERRLGCVGWRRGEPLVWWSAKISLSLIFHNRSLRNEPIVRKKL